MNTIDSRSQGNTFLLSPASNGYIVYIVTISSVFVDVWNMAALCWYLMSRSTKHSRRAVNQIMVLAVGMFAVLGSLLHVLIFPESGLVTSVAAVLILIFVGDGWCGMV
jgi:uncharacterized paraquat-inducible protein A